MRKTFAVESKINFTDEIKDLMNNCPKVTFPESRDALLELAFGGPENNYFEVAYKMPDGQTIREATVSRCKNGAVINYDDIYLRRRDPECMVIADKKETDKERFADKYGYEFKELRSLTFEWLREQSLIIVPFMAGGIEHGYPMLLVAPENAGFFAAGLADLQGFVSVIDIEERFIPRGIIYLAPTFRHTHFDGKQMVVHNRLDNVYEMFSYNLYPGPSAKKGVYGVLLDIGEREGWVTLHGSTVQLSSDDGVTITFMHEGASGGGKSEMVESLNLEEDRSLCIAENTLTHEKHYLFVDRPCDIKPVTDDMAMCPPSLQTVEGKLVVADAENGWFLRTDHIKSYGTAPDLEAMCIHPREPLIFLNYDAVPGGTCLIWDHILDSPGVACPNPRVIMPRKFIEKVVSKPVAVDIRSFGMRSPVSSAIEPSYGIIGFMHVLPPAIAWIWRLVAPRGDKNPSITTVSKGMSSEGVGSYWPFATGKKVTQANLLLEQMIRTTKTKYVLIPNQHIGVYKVGFNPQWVAREFLTQKADTTLMNESLIQAEHPLLGYRLTKMTVNHQEIPEFLLNVKKQEEVGARGFDAGMKILVDFFKAELVQFLTPELHPLGTQIIKAFLKGDNLDEFTKLMPSEDFEEEYEAMCV